VSPATGWTNDPRLITKCWSWDVKLNGSSLRPQFSAAGKYAQIDYIATPDRWQHLAFTFSSGTIKGYVNGKPAKLLLDTFTGTETLPAQNAGPYVGTDAGKAFFTKGLLSDVRVYDRALNDSAIAAVYSQSVH
jgi:hypothetical protein